MPSIQLRVATKVRVSLRDTTLLLNSLALARDGVLLGVRPSDARITDLLSPVGPDLEYLPEGFRPYDWLGFVESFGKELAFNPDITAQPSVVGRAIAIQAAIDTLMPRDTQRDLCLVSLSTGSLDTTIEETFEDIAKWLSRILRRATNLLPGRNRTTFYKEIGQITQDAELPPLSSGLIGLAGVTMETSLRSMRATDITSKS